MQAQHIYCFFDHLSFFSVSFRPRSNYKIPNSFLHMWHPRAIYCTSKVHGLFGFQVFLCCFSQVRHHQSPGTSEEDLRRYQVSPFLGSQRRDVDFYRRARFFLVLNDPCTSSLLLICYRVLVIIVSVVTARLNSEKCTSKQ